MKALYLNAEDCWKRSNLGRERKRDVRIVLKEQSLPRSGIALGLCGNLVREWMIRKNSKDLCFLFEWFFQFLIVGFEDVVNSLNEMLTVV